MILPNCKQILFKWILETGLMQDICFHTDDLCIDDFFLSLFKHIHSVGNLPNLKSLRDENLLEVLRIFTNTSHNSKSRLNDAHMLIQIEYSYLYFLLLHFSYVKYSKTFCGKLCKKLSLESQEIIAKFMAQMYYCPSVTRQAIRDAIIAITYFNSNAKDLHDSGMVLQLKSCDNGMDSQMKSCPYFEIPDNMFKSTTNHVTCKLFNLKSELTASRSKSDILMIKNTEDYHENLLLAFKKYGNKTSLNMEENKQERKLLLKGMFQKENNIFKHSDIVRTLREEKSIIQEKLNYGDNQVVICMKHFRDLDNKLTEVREELKHKDETIEYLWDKKDKLEQILTKVLSLSNCSNVDPRVCSDYLGTSNTEIEYLNLKKELQAMRLENTKLTKQMQYLVQKYSQERQADENVANEEPELESITESFERFTNCVDKLNNLYEKEKIKTKQLQQDIFEIENQNKSLSSRMLYFENEVEEITAYVKSIEEIQKINEQNLSEMDNCKNCIKSLVEKNIDLSAKLSSLKTEYEESKLNADVTEQNFISIIGSLQKSLEEYQELNSQLIHENKELQRNIDALNEKFKFDKTESTNKQLMANIKYSEKNLEILQFTNKELEDKNLKLQISFDKLNEELKLKSTEYRINIETFFKRLSDQNVEIQDHIAAELSVKDEYEKLLVQYEDLKRELRKCDKQLEIMRNDWALKEERELDLRTEIDRLRIKNAALRAKINNSSQKQKHEKKTADLTIKRKEKQIKELQNEKEQFEKLLQMAQTEHENTQKDMKKFSKQHRDFCKDIETIWAMLKQDDENFNGLFYQETQSEQLTDAENKCILYNYLVGIKLRLTELLDYKTAAVAKIKGLESKLIERNAQSREYKGKLQLVLQGREELIKNYENVVLECKKEISFSADKVRVYECKLKDLKRDERMFIELMEKQLHGNIINTLTRLTDHKAQVQAELKEKLNQYEKKVQLLLQENAHLGEEINEIKTSQGELFSQLSNHFAYQRKLGTKLQSSENRCKGLEKKLECSNFNEYEAQIQKLKTYTAEQDKQIEALKSELDVAAEQKEIMLTKSEIKAAQLHQEQEDKAVLLKSLESTADQFKMNVEQIDALEKLCIELRSKLSEVNAENEKLQNDAVAKEMDFKTQCEQLKSERSDMQSEIIALMHKAAEQTEELESTNTELINIIDILEDKLTAIETSQKAVEVQNIFDIKVDRDTHFNELKHVLNKMMHRILKMKTDANASREALEYLEVLEKCNTELENKLNQNVAKTYVLQETLASEVQSSKNYLKNIVIMKENLIAENEKLKLKLAAYENEIVDLKTEVAKLFDIKKKQTKAEHLNLGIVKNLKIKEKNLRENLKSKQLVYNELQGICSMQQVDIKEKSSIIHNLQKDLDESFEQNSKLRTRMEQLQLEMSLNDNNIKVLNEKCRSILESNTCPSENDLSIKSGESVGLQAKIVQLACVRNNLTRCIFVYKRHLKNSSKKNSK